MRRQLNFFHSTFTMLIYGYLSRCYAISPPPTIVPYNHNTTVRQCKVISGAGWPLGFPHIAISLSARHDPLPRPCPCQPTAAIHQAAKKRSFLSLAYRSRHRPPLSEVAKSVCECHVCVLLGGSAAAPHRRWVGFSGCASKH